LIQEIITLTQRYAKTEVASKYLDVDISFLKKRMGTDFIEGIHYHKPANCRLLRWDITALEQWLNGSSQVQSSANNALVGQLLSKLL
jgi:hypothetical protein